MMEVKRGRNKKKRTGRKYYGPTFNKLTAHVYEIVLVRNKKEQNKTFKLLKPLLEARKNKQNRWTHQRIKDNAFEIIKQAEQFAKTGTFKSNKDEK